MGNYAKIMGSLVLKIKMERVLCLFFVLSMMHFHQISSQSLSCISDSDCEARTQSHCDGLNFVICFGQMKTTEQPGKCVMVRNQCGIAQLIAGSSTCSGKQCAGCLKNSDRTRGRICTNFTCVFTDHL